jgi:hypothetical protein
MTGAIEVRIVIEESSFSGLLTLVEMGHIRIRSAGNGPHQVAVVLTACVGWDSLSAAATIATPPANGAGTR